MTPIEAAVRQFHDRVAEAQRVLGVIDSVMGICPDSDLSNAVWGLVGGYMAAIGQMHHCEVWLEWWWLECGLGAQPKGASPAGGRRRKVETIDDLVALILEDSRATK